MAFKDQHVVICVDDEPAVLAALRRSLRHEPYQLLTTDRPEEALQWVGTREISLVITDQRMPEMTGTQLLEEVSRRSPATARIILSAFAGSTNGPGIRRQVDCMISKPWDNQMLRVAIRQLLRDRELLDADEEVTLIR